LQRKILTFSWDLQENIRFTVPLTPNSSAPNASVQNSFESNVRSCFQ
jgi:hypothetical protein